MASTIATVNQSLVDQKVTEALRYVLPMFQAFSFKPESEPAIKSDVVYVPVAGSQTVASKTAGTLLTATGSLTGTAVTCSNFYGSAWDAVEGTMPAKLLPAWWAESAAEAVYQTAKHVVDAALAVVTAANFGSTEGTDKLTCAAADFGQLDLASLWKMAESKIKGRERSLGLNPTYAAALLGDGNMGLVLATTGSNFIETGVLPGLMGMRAWCYGGFPANGENLGGAVFGKGAIAVCAAPPDPLMAAGDGNIRERRIITDPASGLSVLYTQKADAGGALTGEVCVLYGVAKNQDAVIRLVSA